MKKVFIVVGKSGSGKNYIMDLLGHQLVPGNTTRDKRPTDHSYSYFSKIYYNRHVNKEDIIIPTEYCGNNYWTWRSDYYDASFDYVIPNLEGLKSLVEDYESGRLFRPYKIIYIKCPLIKRIKNMRKRKDSWKNIFIRIKNDRKDFKGGEKFVKDHGGFFINV